MIIYCLAFISGAIVQAAQEGVQTFSFDGRAFSNSSATTALLDGSVQFKIQILNNAQDCILYEETQTKDTNATNGYFTLQVGSATGAGKRSSGDNGNQMAMVYSNTSGSINGKLLADGITVCPYNPVAGHTRYVRVTMTPSGDGISRVLSPLIALDSVPSAVVAERADTLQGLLANQFIQVNTTSSNVSQANLNSLFATTSLARLTSLTSADPSTYIGATTAFTPGLGSAAAPSIAFSGDSNTGIFSPGADTIAMATDGVERFRVNASGDMGIGTNNPSSKLEVSGGAISNIMSALGVTNTNGFFISNPTLATAGNPQYSPQVQFKGSAWDTTSGTAKSIDVKMGVTPPSGAFASWGPTFSIKQSIDGGAYGDVITFSQYNGITVGSSALITAQLSVPYAPINESRFDLRSTSGDGISMTNSTAATALEPVQMSPRFRIRSQVWDTGALANRTSDWGIEDMPISGNPASSFLRINNSWNGAAYTNYMGISSNGNVGIGTTTPSAPLEVVRSSPGTITSAGTTVTGTGTSFTTTFKVGDSIYANGQVRTIATIGNDTTLTTSSAFNPVLGGINYTRTQAKINGTLEIQADGIGATTGVGSPYQDLLVLKNYGTSGNWQTGAAIKFEGLGAKTLARIGANWDGPNAGDLIFTTNAPTSGYMIYNVGGNFGIGSKQTIEGLFDISSATGPIFTLSRDDTTVVSGDVIGAIQFWNNDANSTTQKIFGNIEMQAAQDIATDAAAGNMIFRTTGTTLAGAPVERMRIDSSGRLGVGNMTPSESVDISGRFARIKANIENSMGLILDAGIAQNHWADVRFRDRGSEMWALRKDDSNIFRVHSYTLGSAVMSFLENGMVGIGDTSPDTTLKVTGSLCVKSDGNNCAGAVAGTIYANNTTVQSADYAEYFLSEVSLEKGEVVGLNAKTGLARKYQAGDKLLGIVSTSPGVVGNSDIKDKKSVLVALMGQVPVKSKSVRFFGNSVKTIDGQQIGFLLASGDVYINISSNHDSSETKNKIQKLEAENLEMRKRLEKIERAIAQEN